MVGQTDVTASSIKMRMRREVLFSLTDFIGAFGGATSLFLGINVWRFAMIMTEHH